MTKQRRKTRINVTAALLVVGAGLVVGFTVFFMTRVTTDAILKRTLMSNLAMREQVVVRAIQEGHQKLRMVASRPFLAHQVALADRGQVIERHVLDRGMQSFLHGGFSSIVLQRSSGSAIAKAGRIMTASGLSVPLVGLGKTRLLWSARQGFVLRSRMAFRVHGHKVGWVVGEIPLPAIGLLFRDTKTLGPSTDLALCAPHGGRMSCFPTVLDPKKVFLNMSRSWKRRPLPMAFALTGHSGFVITKNYKGHTVAGAYAPVAHLGLGMVLTMNASALYAPVWRQLWVTLPVTLLVLMMAIGMLRWRLAPLVSELHASEQEARDAVQRWHDSERYVAAVLEHADEGIATMSETGIVETFNPAMERLFGYSASDIVGQNITVLMPEPYAGQHDGYLARYRDTGEARVIGTSGREVVGRHRDGTEIPVDLRVAEFFLEGRRHFIGTVRDATARKAAENRMRHVATHDALTDLPNRDLIRARIEQLIRRCERSGQLFAVMFIDLDRFKGVNDSVGHGAGDDLLRLVAQRLREALRPEDTVGRQGGDEFIVLAANLTIAADAVSIASKLLPILSVPYAVSGHTLSIGASIGIALYPKDGREVDALLKQSDAAMYQAKQAGGNTYCVVPQVDT